MNDIKTIIESCYMKAVLLLETDQNLKTKTDFLLLYFFDNVFIVFKDEQEAKTTLKESFLTLNIMGDIKAEEIDIIFKVFKLLQYVTLLSEEIYITNKTIEILEMKINSENTHILSPIIKNMHEGLINKILKVYDKTKIKREKSFSIINIQRDYGLTESTLCKRDFARNTLFSHLSLDHSIADQSQFNDYDKLYMELKGEIINLLSQIAPTTLYVYERILLLNDKFTSNALGRLYSNTNYHKLVTHTDEQFKEYYIYDFNERKNL